VSCRPPVCSSPSTIAAFMRTSNRERPRHPHTPPPDVAHMRGDQEEMEVGRGEDTEEEEEEEEKKKAT